MKPTTQLVRPKAWIPFTNFAIVDQVPGTIKLQDHMFPYEGADMETGEDGFIWGLYGTLASNQGLFLADAFARRHGKMPLTVQGWYMVDHFERVRSQIDSVVANDSGFLHLERLKASFKEELRLVVLRYAAKNIPGWDDDVYDEKTLSELVMAHPKLIKAIFDYNKNINMVVHPVRQVYDSADHRSLTIATMRMNRARIMSVQVRYLEDQVAVEF
jgi:hypothetical protein